MRGGARPVSTLLIAAAAMAAATACGGDSSGHAPGAVAEGTASTMTTSELSAGRIVAIAGGFFMLGVGDDDTPPKTLYRAFRRPITEGDRAAAAIAQSNELLTSLGGSDPTYSDGRLVAGTPHDGIFAVPMPDDTVCSAQLPIGGGGCGSVGYDGLTADFSGGHDSDPLQLYGLAGDEIEGVDVVVAGVPQAATMGENGYRLTVRGRRGADIDRIILHLRSGERQVFELSAVSVDG